VETVKIYCPKCSQVYHSPPIRSSRTGNAASGVDGAAFGTTFPHLFLMTFSNLVPDPLSTASTYVPRVFGFRVHQSARQRNPPSEAATTTTTTTNALVKSDKAPADAIQLASTADRNGKSPPALAAAAEPQHAEGEEEEKVPQEKRKRDEGNGTLTAPPPPAFPLDTANPKRRKKP
jgi:hypothetical protein